MLLFLVRHTQPEIEQGWCYGRLDVELSPFGVARMAQVSDVLHDLELPVWTSPAIRCRRLAEHLVPTPRVDHRLQELDFGEWEGRHWDHVPRVELDAWAADPETFAPPGGESVRAMRGRVEAVCHDLVRRREDCIVVTHGGPIRLMAALLRGREPNLLAQSPPFGSVTRIEVPAQGLASTVRTAASDTIALAPSTSPVKPPS